MVVNPGEQTMSLIHRVFQTGWQGVYTMFASLCTLFAPAVPAIITAYSFILLDMYYGYKVSKKFGKPKFESNKFWRTINKFTETALLICGALLLDNYILHTADGLAVVRMAAGSVCAAETISLLESMKALYPDHLLSRILSKIIKSKAEKYLETDISDIVDNDSNGNRKRKRKVA